MKKALIPLIAAVFMGLIAAAMARHLIKSHGPVQQHLLSVKVVTAKVELPPGHALVAEDLTLAPIAASAPPPNTSNDPARLVGRVIVAPLLAGQPVLDTQLAPPGSQAGLQSLVPEGMRAISLDATDSNGMLALLVPGSHVDVVTTASGSNSSEPAVSRIIAQDVRVLAVGPRLAGAAPKEGDGQTAAARTVTLLVTPHDAAALDLAQSMARMRLILRGSTDHGEVDDDPVMMTDLRGGVVAPVTTAIQTSPVSTPPATQPTQPAQPVAVVATTQPVNDPPVPTEAPRRIVTLIMGNQEQRLSFREPTKATDRQLTDTKDPNDPFANP